MGRNANKGQQLFHSFGFDKKNYMLFGIGLLIVIVGYILMYSGETYSFLSISLSPLILVIGYCFIIPFSTSLPVLCFSVLLQGFAMGFLDTGGNLLLLRLHSEPDPSQAEPYMQAMHFSFALGALVIPLIMAMLNDLKKLLRTSNIG